MPLKLIFEWIESGSQETSSSHPQCHQAGDQLYTLKQISKTVISQCHQDTSFYKEEMGIVGQIDN